MKSKKGFNQVGIAIIAMAVLLLLGGIFTSDDGGTSPNYNNYYDYNSPDGIGYNVTNPNYLFYLSDTTIGRDEKKVMTSANIELGSKKEYNTIYIGNNFLLNANPFTANSYSVDVNIRDVDEINGFLLYFKTIRSGGNANLKVYLDGRLMSNNLARDFDIPIYLNAYDLDNKSMVRITFQLEKPKWYQIFNWNKLEIDNLKVVEERENRDNKVRDFTFLTDFLNLDRVYMDLSISCENTKEVSEPIKVIVNGQIISNDNVDCSKRNNVKLVEIPLEVLDASGNNKLEFQTDGYYKIAYALNKIYYNDQDLYLFNLNSFNDIIDVIIRGDFDKDVIDLRINSQTISLTRDEIKSVLPYLRYGVNEIKILTKPVEIKELIIEKNEFIY